MTEKQEIINLNANSNQDQFLSQLDLPKLGRIAWRNSPWVLIIFFICIFIAFTYLRYTKPVYESKSNIKLESQKAQNKVNVLGLKSTNIDIGNLYGEIEFITSNLLCETVVDVMDLEISYFQEGRFLDSEIYPNRPFEVFATIENESLYDLPFYIQIIDKQNFTLNYNYGEQNISNTYKFNQEIKQSGFSFIIKNNASLSTGYFYFIVNSRSSLVTYIQSHLKAIILNANAQIIENSFIDSNPRKAQAILQVVDSVYLQKTLEKKNLANRQQKKYLEEQIEKVQDDLRVYESQLEDFVRENKTRNTDNKFSEAISEVKDLVQEKTRIREQLNILLEMESFVYRSNTQDQIIPYFNFSQNSQLSTLLVELNALRQRRRELLYYKNENTTVVQVLDQQMTDLQKNITELIAYNKKQVLNSLGGIETQIAQLEGEMIGLPEKSTEYNRILRLYGIYENYYLKMLDRQAEIGIAGAGIIPEFIILSPASFPTSPISPKKLTIYGISVLVAFFLSFVLLATRYLLNNTIISRKDLENLTKAPILGVIPQMKSKKEGHSTLIVKADSRTSTIEAFKSIRTNLDFMFPKGKGLMAKEHPKVLSVTSTISGEGKTFTAVNLGGVIALVGLKVVILDFDLRKPRVHLAFNRMEDENTKGISTILVGKHQMEDCIRHSSLEGLDFISSGPIPFNPSELILQNDLDELLEKLKSVYDVIIIDTPPLGLVTDANILMQKVDAAIYLFRANFSHRNFTKSINHLYQNQYKNLTLIMNGVKKTGEYYYNNRGYYRYHSGYYQEEESTNLFERFLKVFIRKNK